MPEFLIIPEVAELTRVSVHTVRRAIRNGQLRTVRAGARILIPRAELSAWLGLDTEAN
jgi:excisionase family DNA binding protein